MRRFAPIALAAALAAGTGTADARPGLDPWATVNVCDTLDHPNQIGIRGEMPGLKRTTRMSMRFRVQYRDEDGRWRYVGSGADSGWQAVAVARGGEHDMGWTFTFRPPEQAGGGYELRGVVQFAWRRGARTVERMRRVTEAGHPDTAGADPEDFSASTCVIV